jgi:phage terminase large subunit GpA-like protein
MADCLKDELEPMIRANPSLEKKIGLGRQPRQLGRTNNTRRKSFAGGTALFSVAPRLHRWLSARSRLLSWMR